MYSGSALQTSHPGQPVRSAASRRIGTALRLAALVTAAAVGGCGSVPATINPVTWWHALQGGQIAEQRPPPPGATDPYPNLASVPDRPAPLDPNIRKAVDQGLIADRANAQHEAAAAPIADPPSRTASAGLSGATNPLVPPVVPTKTTPLAPADAAAGPSATLAAANAPPVPDTSVPPPAAPAARARHAPVAPADATPLGQLAEGSTAQMGPLPTLPASPPAPADLPGASPPPPPPIKPPSPPPAAAPLPDGSIAVPFAPTAATLAPDGAAAVHAVTVKWSTAGAKAGIVIIGYGDAASSDPAIQANALTLALLRARATAKALVAEGLPAGAMVTDAQAEGRGAAVRLVN